MATRVASPNGPSASMPCAQIGSDLLEGGEVIVVLEDQIVELALRRQAARPGVDLELPDEAASDFAEALGLARNGADESSAFGFVEIGDIVEDFGARTDCGDTRQDAVEELGQQWVGAKAVRIVVGVGLGALQGPVETRDRHSCGRLLGHQIVGRRRADATEQRVGERLIDLGDQPMLGLATELADVEVERLRQPEEQRAADLALVGFDEIEVARRDAGAAGQRRLREADGAALGADPQADRCAHLPPELSLYLQDRGRSSPMIYRIA